MTMRLVLVGLVAALGLTIPQWSNPESGIGSTQAAKVAKLNDRTVRSIHRGGRTDVADRRIVQGAHASSYNRFQQVGLGSGVVRSGTKYAANFWQVPSGTRAVGAVTPVVASSTPVEGGRPRFEPIEFRSDEDADLADSLNRQSEGLSMELLGPPARLKPIKYVSRPIELGDDLYEGLALALNRQAEGTGRMPREKPAPRIELQSDQQHRSEIDAIDRIADFAQNPDQAHVMAHVRAVSPVTAPRTAGSSSSAWLGRLDSHVEAIYGNLGRRINETGLMLRTASDYVRNLIATRIATRAVVPPGAGELVAVSLTFPEFPDDVFAGDDRQLIAARTAEAVELASLPEDVFAIEDSRPTIPEITAPAQLANLPDDVFAPEASVPVQAVTVGETPVETIATTNKADDVSRSTLNVAEAKTASNLGVTIPIGDAGTKFGPDHLTKAVSLTREAAFAWMKLLSGPAVVTLTR